MSLPVSQYEALLAEVRGLRRKAQRVQQLARPLIGEDLSHSQVECARTTGRHSSLVPASVSTNCSLFQNEGINAPLDYTMESLSLDRQQHTSAGSPNYENAASLHSGPEGSSEDECCGGAHSSTHLSVSSEPVSRRNRNEAVNSLYHGTWPVERTMWNSEPISLGDHPTQHQTRRESTSSGNQMDVNSVMSFASSSGGVPLDRVLGNPDLSSQQLEAKMDVVHSLLSMLGSQDHIDMGETLLALSTCPESCLAMRQSGCIPLLVQLVQSDKDSDNRKKASQALHNLVNSQPDEKLRKRESRILKLSEHIQYYTEALRSNTVFELESSSHSEDGDKHPVQTIAHLMKLSFDEGHRQAICQLGGIHTIASLVEAEHTLHGSTSTESHCILMRRYACMALTNLTFGDSGNKALLCSFREFMRALVVQLQSTSDELRQVTASVLRNLSWRADSTSKEVLREVGSVTGLMKAAMLDNKENTLKSILSALWNLSAHCTENKSEICAVEGALGFLVNMLTYKTPSKSLAIIENSGGILRNISSQIAVREDYREVLRTHNCLQVLLEQLKSPSLTIVSNACGTLWNLSAKCATDQETLWQMGAPAMLRSLNHSKHKMIAMGSSAALKNLLSARPQQALIPQMDSTALSLNLPELPTLGARKQKALLQDLDTSLTETYENIEKDSPKKSDKNLDIIDFIQDSHKTEKKKSTRSSPEDLSNAFSSLNLNEPSTSYSSDVRSKSRIPQNFGSISLPYVPRTNPCTYIPVRNKVSDCGFEDEMELNEQPIDYSRKYSETKSSNNSNKVSSKEEGDSYNKSREEDSSFGIYAETDLDQPTDYSLRYAEPFAHPYAEDDSDSDICNKITKEFVQDTIKTYCTEGTPYETPFIFSTATSMSDLRNVEEKPSIDNDILKSKPPKTKEIKNLDEKERCSTEDISEIDNSVLPKQPKLEFSSGLMSPEKPVNYCEEGTPGYFSRVSSFGSLNSIPANDTVKNERKDESIVHQTIIVEKEEKKMEEEEKTAPKTPSETKNVKFEQTVNYAEETPLMFSRSSSLASLDSIEQHSIHDDRSSVVSDFSRLTSGIVSPSELPDSPTQTIPPSLKPTKPTQEIPSTSKQKSTQNKSQLLQRSTQKPSVFEDNITMYKEESTPIQFSTATSLSSLTIDDREENEMESSKSPESKILQQQSNISSSTTNTGESAIHKEDQQEKKDSEKEASGSDDSTQESEDDDDILAACISDGMQNNRRIQPNPTASSTPSKLPLSNFKYHSKPQASTSSLTTNPRSLSTAEKSILQDNLKSYCTEDTPAQFSLAGSNSDLSALSFPNDKSKKDYLSDDSSNLSGNNDILAECIQSAMPKAKKEVNKQINFKPTTCLPTRSGNVSVPVKLNLGVSNVRREKTESRKVHGINRKDNSLPLYLMSKDEVENYAVENSPCQISLRSSLSDLTVDGSVSGLNTLKNNQLQDAANSKNDVPSQCGINQSANLNISQENNSSQVDRRESLSSISIESLGSDEGEQALLEQCIYSGMPTDRAEEALLEECISAGMPKSSSSTTISNSLDGSRKSSAVASKQTSGHKQDRIAQKKETVGADKKPKNVNAASVAGNTAVTLLLASGETSPNMSHAATDVEGNQKPELKGTENVNYENKNLDAKTETLVRDTSPDKCSHFEGNFLTGPTKSGYNKSITKILGNSFDHEYSFSNCDNYANIDNCFSKSCEETGKIVDHRMLDPDAMIESLDRFTAELVSQASHLSKEEDKYKVSTNDNTWNDDTSPNEVTFPSLSGSAPHIITFESDREPSNEHNCDRVDGNEQQSHDFSSVNTSTMTESTLIAIEASKMATVFKNEAEMSLSITGAASLELDLVRPPSQLNSMVNSAVGVEKGKSPKLVTRKKSLTGLLVKRALSSSLNNASSLESLDNHSITNLDHMNPPSDIQNVFDMEGSMTSIASLPHESAEIKADFMINGITNKDLQSIHQHNPIFNIKQQYISSSLNSYNLDHVNPPSFFNEITDMCNSLADVATEAICSETEVFEDCCTHILDNTLQDDDPTAEFSDANSVTPIQSDISSTESTPKKTKSLSKSMTAKQRRNFARDRYKTYTVAAEMVMREEAKIREEYSPVPDSTTEENVIVNDQSETTTYVVDTSRVTPKERRKMDRSRFETQILDEALTSVLQKSVVQTPTESCESNSCSSSPGQSPARTKLSIRRSFMQKRLENRDRFKTQTLSESSFSPDALSGDAETELHLLVQKEADLVLKSLGDTKMTHDEFLDCETLSLVSNDDDSEHNSGSSMNYRTYHKSWGIKKNIPVISSKQNGLVNCRSNLTIDPESNEENQQTPVITKPKIVKPLEKEAEDTVNEEQDKGIRGRRKPLYSKSNLNNKMAQKSIKPIKTMTSNLVKNVTSTLKSGAASKSVANKQKKTISTKPPVAQSRTSSKLLSNSNSPKTSPARVPLNKVSPKHKPPLERQGTFTKEDLSSSTTPKMATKIPTPGSKIPAFTSKIARPVPPSRIPSNNNIPKPSAARSTAKSASSDRANKNSRIYNRSTSADSREPVRKIQASPSTQSLKNETRNSGGAVKKSRIATSGQRSNSNSSLTSNGSGGAKKQVTSKIANIWKKIEESKTKQQSSKKDTRVWIQNNEETNPPRLIRSNTFDNKDGIILRKTTDQDCGESAKRVSRLGSFILMDENQDGGGSVQQNCAVAMGSF